jgi:ubiquinone/menaquinone biosynthesis C-methylase UbiE
MPDVYARIAEVDTATQERLGDILEMRTADAQQQRMWDDYLSDIDFPANSAVLEIGCGTGAVSRKIAQKPNLASILGVDPSPVFVARAQQLARDIPNLSFEVHDGRALDLAEESFDVVVVHQALSHVPGPEDLLNEAFRVLKHGGWLAVYDGDYATATVALSPYDPLEACAHAFRSSFVHDPWVMRRVTRLMRSSGFETRPMRSHGYVESGKAGYMFTWIDRGADALLQDGSIDGPTAEAIKTEAHRRQERGAWFGHIAFASILGRKPAM